MRLNWHIFHIYADWKKSPIPHVENVMQNETRKWEKLTKMRNVRICDWKIVAFAKTVAQATKIRPLMRPKNIHIWKITPPTDGEQVCPTSRYCNVKGGKTGICINYQPIFAYASSFPNIRACARLQPKVWIMWPKKSHIFHTCEFFSVAYMRRVCDRPNSALCGVIA